MVLSGGTKLHALDRHVQDFERWGYPQWFRILVGWVEVGGGLGVLLGRRYPSVGVVGGGLVAATMVGALYTHLVRVDDSPGEAAPAMALLGVSTLVTVRHRRERRDRTKGGSE